jgi:hypothetical protein
MNDFRGVLRGTFRETRTEFFGTGCPRLFQGSLKGLSYLLGRLEQGPPARVLFLSGLPRPRTLTMAVAEGGHSKKSSRASYQEKMAVTGDGIVLTYWHWLEYDSVALAALFGGIGLVTLLALSI